MTPLPISRLVPLLGSRADALLRDVGGTDIVRAPRKVAGDNGHGKGFQRGEARRKHS